MDLRENQPQEAEGVEPVNDVAVHLANKALCDLNEILSLKNAEATETVDVSVGDSNRVVRLPRSTAETLRQVLATTAAGSGVTVIPAHAEFTTQQAADILGVSRPYLIKLLEAGELAYRKVGTHRRILASSLREYTRKMEIESRNAADELTQLSEELGLYDR